MKKKVSSLNLFLLFIFLNSCNLFKKNNSERISVLNKKKQSNGISISSQWIISRFEENENSTPEIIKSSLITINEKEGTFQGNGGCNKIFGKLKVENNKIKFSNMISTKMYCDNMAQETKFTQALELTETFKIDGCELHLYQNNKKIMTLESCR